MIKHTLSEDQHPHKMTLTVCHSHEHKLQADSSNLMAFNKHPSVPHSCSTLRRLSLGTRVICLLQINKACKTSFAYSQDFSNICFRKKVLSVVLRPGQKPHWPFSSFHSTFFFQDTHRKPFLEN